MDKNTKRKFNEIEDELIYQNKRIKLLESALEAMKPRTSCIATRQRTSVAAAHEISDSDEWIDGDESEDAEDIEEMDAETTEDTEDAEEEDATEEEAEDTPEETKEMDNDDLIINLTAEDVYTFQNSVVIPCFTNMDEAAVLNTTTLQKFTKYCGELQRQIRARYPSKQGAMQIAIDYFKVNNSLIMGEVSYSRKVHNIELCKCVLVNVEWGVSSVDYAYFISMPLMDKIVSVESLRNIHETNKRLPPLFELLIKDIPPYEKNIILDRQRRMQQMNPNDSEYHKLDKWLNVAMRLPFNIQHKYHITTATHSADEIGQYLVDSRQILDNAIYGQVRTKDHIIQIISKLISNPTAENGGNVFAIYGPPGTGKTTIIKKGLAEALKIPFAFISLGGASDSSFLDGHNYTYEGSNPGKIVDVLVKSRCVNPIFYFDELDKVSTTARGAEIINLLIHLVDSSQNTHFADKYFNELPLDLSKAIFVFSFNDVTKINPILLDRMELIKVDGFNDNEKFIIAKQYLLPEILQNYLIPPNIFEFPDDSIKYIAQRDDSGVRTIKRHIDNIISKLNILYITDASQLGVHSNIASIKSHISVGVTEVIDSEIVYPIVVTRAVIDALINNTVNANAAHPPPFGMYM
jgi:ATP-dependent Lon protease